MISELLYIEGTKPGLTPDILGYLFGMPISNVWAMTVLISVICIITLIVLNRRLTLIPSNFQILAEMTVEGMETLIYKVTGSQAAVNKLLGVAGPLLVFLLISNLIGLIPGLSSVSYNGFSLFRTVTSDYNMTLVLGVLVSLFINGSTILQIGVIAFVEKFIQIRNIITSIPKGFLPFFESCIAAFVGVMDIIGEIAKILSMTLRLFGNIYAGEVMTVVFYGLFAAFVPTAWHMLSSFSGIIQALVFTMLTIVFYSLAVDASDGARE
jgi:F-type H+-transporting ATPase subunit a